MHDRLILGKENVLVCEVSSVYPSEFVEVHWLFGDTVMKTDEGKPNKDVLSIPYVFTPSSEDDGKAITCRATLDVEGIPADEMTKKTSELLKVLCKHRLY